MKYKTLSKEEALSLCDDLSKAPQGTRLVFDKPLEIEVRSTIRSVFALGNDFLFAGEESSAIRAGLAHIEVPEPEPDPFAHPAFEGWKITSDRDGKTASRAGFRMYGRGILDYEQSFVRHFNPEDAPAIAESVNRLVAIGEVSESNP